MSLTLQTNPQFFWHTIYAVLGLFGAGILLVLMLSRFTWYKIRHGGLGARYIGWMLLVPIYLLSLFTNNSIMAALVLLSMTLCICEYCHAAKLHRSDRIFLYGCAGFTLLIVIFKPALFSMMPGLVLLLLTLMPILHNKPQWLHQRVQFVLYGYIYTVWSLAHVFLMLKLPDGHGMMLIALMGCGLADIGAYVVGKKIGRTVIASNIHAQKAYEGVLGNLAGALITVVLFRYSIPFYTVPMLLAFVLIIGVGSSWGDIISSLAKRTLGVKDWGTTIPGHGGLLDRFNSVIIVIPLMYYFLLMILPSS